MALAYSTAKYYTSLFFRVRHPVITVNGIRSDGWLHRTRNGNVIFFTEHGSGRGVTYELVLTDNGNGHVFNCGAWVAPRWPTIPIGDLNPPCFLLGYAGRDLTRGSNSVSFSTLDGRRLEASLVGLDNLIILSPDKWANSADFHMRPLYVTAAFLIAWAALAQEVKRPLLSSHERINGPFAGEYHVEDLQVFQDVKVVYVEEGIRPMNSFEVAGGYALCAAGNFAFSISVYRTESRSGADREQSRGYLRPK